MQMSITFRHMESDDEIKRYAWEKLQRLEKYIDAPMEIQLTCIQEKHRHRVEVLLKADGVSVAGQEETSDFRSSLDAVVDNLERQLKKQKKRFRQHKTSNEERAWRLQMDATSPEGHDESAEPQIVVSRNVFAKPMSLEEAVMQMKLTENEFIVFRDSSTDKINVLYRRNDGDFGLIEPEAL